MGKYYTTNDAIMLSSMFQTTNLFIYVTTFHKVGLRLNCFISAFFWGTGVIKRDKLFGRGAKPGHRHKKIKCTF